MHWTGETIAEIEILAGLDLTTTMVGIKVHKDADPIMVAAVERLHQKQLLTQSDGGYLTDLGREAAEHIQAAMTILSTASFLPTQE